MQIFNFDLVKARSNQYLLFWLSVAIGVFGPAIAIGTKFDLYTATESNKKLQITFVGILVLFNVAIYFTKEITEAITSWEQGTARTILLSLFEIKEWILLLFVVMFLRSDWFSTRIDEWYMVIAVSTGLAFLGRLVKRGSEYYRKYISDRKLYEKFKEWDTQEG